MDDFAVTSNNIATVMVASQEFPPLDISLALNSSEVGSRRQVSLTIHATSGTSPVENASIALLSIVGGILTPSSGITNSTGHFTATFSAPNVTQITNVRIIATASKSNYADGSDHKYLKILPPLSVQVTADPETIKSEATANVAVHVAYSGLPIPDATVVISSAEGGKFDQEIETTNENGDCTFVFTAPHTGRHLNVTITATATKSGYIDGQGQTKIAVEQALFAQIVANPVSFHSEMTSNITIRVTYESNPIPDAVVMLSSDKGGEFSSADMTTDANGECVFAFTAPRTTEPTNITITATATKMGYADGRNQTTVAVNPGQLNVQVIANPSTIESEAISTITVHVTSNTRPTAYVVVTVSSEGVGKFSFTVSNTDINGDCTFVFTAPHTGGHLDVTITATATKSGYIDGQGQTRITVNPAPLSFMLTTIIIVVAVIVVITVILVLIKLRIIVISWKEV